MFWLLAVYCALTVPPLSAQNALGSSSAPALLGGPSAPVEFLPVEEAYPLGVEVEGERALRLVWQMPPGYYLYQHAFRFSIEGDAGAEELNTEFPPAITREDEYFGVVQVYYDSLELVFTTRDPVYGSTLTVTSQGCADAGLCYPPRTQRFAIDASGQVSEIDATPGRPSQTAAPQDSTADLAVLGSMLLFAFIGGLILNLMPCVFPILSLKVLGFASTAPQERHVHGWFYSAGVVASFITVAAVLMALRSAGQAVGWGFQLQSPGFVTALAYLFTVMGLALSGVVHIGGGLMNLGSGLAERGGASGSFFTGVLAVVVASPCTAPFMGSALGFALTQPVSTGLLIFASLGAGMALPLLLLSYSEWARRRIPKPGPWMQTLQQVLAFPLYATALWLFWVAGRQLGVDFMAAALFGALLLALALWLWQGAWARRAVAFGCVLAAVALASWRPEGVPGEHALPEGSIAYSPQRLEQLLADGKPVFVDVTADWCITCLANERAVLSQSRVQEAFRRSGVAYMVADWTDYDPLIADFVSSHGRSGIPLYVLYDGAAGSTPQILPQILRSDTLLSALAGVAGPARIAANP